MRRRALSVAAVVFAVEVLIATVLRHVTFVRATLGDYLVVFILYFGALGVFGPGRLPAKRLGVSVFVFSAAAECAQGLHLADALGLEPGGLAHTVLGATFSVGDLVAYALGCVTCVWVDRRWVRG